MDLEIKQRLWKVRIELGDLFIKDDKGILTQMRVKYGTTEEELEPFITRMILISFD